MKNALNRFLLLASSLCLPLCLSAALYAQNGAQDNTQDNAGQNRPAEAAATNEKSIDNTAVTPRETRRKLLGEELATESLVWLQAQGEKFLALWEPDSSGASLGAILILHGEGQTPDWPDTINPLRTNLMQFGWSTLAIELPDPDPVQHPDAQVQMTEARAQAHIQAAVDYLDQKGQYNLVIFGVGAGAARGMEFIKKQPEKTRPPSEDSTISVRGPFRALIMVSAREVVLAQDFRLPTLDLFYDEHYLDDKEVRERLELAKKFRLPHYHQVRMLKPDVTAYGEENRLTRRVRGFLNKYAKGVEVKRR